MKRTLAVSLLLLGSSLVFSCKHKPDDAAIKAAIDKQISTNAAYSSLSAEVKDGVVTLSGTVADEASKTGAEAMAKAVEGVKEVTDNATVVAPAPVAAPEPAVAAPVSPMEQQLKDATKDFPGVQATISADGVVTLNGTIQKSSLARLMQSVNGLKPKKIENKLTVQ